METSIEALRGRLRRAVNLLLVDARAPFFDEGVAFDKRFLSVVACRQLSSVPSAVHQLSARGKSQQVGANMLKTKIPCDTVDSWSRRERAILG